MTTSQIDPKINLAILNRLRCNQGSPAKAPGFVIVDHSKSLWRRPSSRSRPDRTWQGRQYYRGNLRRRLQFQWSVYEQSTSLLGMTPSRYKAGGTNEDIRFAIGQSSLGAILVASSDKGVASILIGDDPNALVEDLQDRFPKARLVGGDAEYEMLVAQVVGFVEAPNLGLHLPLDVRGTAFQQRVWQALREIPAGQTASYTEVAAKIGSPKSVRAVAGACAANNIAIAIPCHRVVRNDGALSGYAWGVDRKRSLIERETVAA